VNSEVDVRDVVKNNTCRNFHGEPGNYKTLYEHGAITLSILGIDIAAMK
jgi:hypothetical protein